MVTKPDMLHRGNFQKEVFNHLSILSTQLQARLDLGLMVSSTLVAPTSEAVVASFEMWDVRGQGVPG